MQAHHPTNTHSTHRKTISTVHWNESHLTNEWNHFLMIMKTSKQKNISKCLWIEQHFIGLPMSFFISDVWIHNLCATFEKNKNEKWTEKDPSSFFPVLLNNNSISILENWYANKTGKRWKQWTMNDKRCTRAWNDFDCYLLIQNKTMLSRRLISKAIIWHLLFWRIVNVIVTVTGRYYYYYCC